MQRKSASPCQTFLPCSCKSIFADFTRKCPVADSNHRKPNTALGNPWPEPTVLPHLTQADDCGDYESELAVVLGKACKNVSEADAMDYVLGYTACNDVSSRTYQMNQSQWCFAKGFDGSCPLGKMNLPRFPKV